MKTEDFYKCPKCGNCDQSKISKIYYLGKKGGILFISGTYCELCGYNKPEDNLMEKLEKRG